MILPRPLQAFIKLGLLVLTPSQRLVEIMGGFAQGLEYLEHGKPLGQLQRNFSNLDKIHTTCGKGL
jgi:hypothetical protein